MERTIGVGLLGMGVVGEGVARVLSTKKDLIRRQIGVSVDLRGVLVRDRNKPRSYEISKDLFVDSIEDLIDNTEVDIVIEVIGGEYPALDYILASVKKGKNVVTANKEVMAKHGPDIFQVARENNVRVLFEASVAGGTPIVSPLMRDLVANDIKSIKAIINGTTNYILTKMAQEKSEFADTLREAQSLGYAEPDPTNDVDGVDAVYKLAILSTLAFRGRIRDTDIYCEGLSRLEPQDFQYAEELGYAIKLLAIATLNGRKVQARVHPALIRKDQMLAKVDGVLNAVEVEADIAESILFHGPGAGSMPTASAVIGDVVNISRNLVGASGFPDPLKLSENIVVQPITSLRTQYYVRLEAEDSPGVLAQIASVLGQNEISISSFIQKGTNHEFGTAELVIMTHEALEGSIQNALDGIHKLGVVASVGNMIRVVQ
jgi:homoserine dehydrogenase